MIVGTSIDNLLVGGPAYNSQKLAQGDVVLFVDGVPVTEDSIGPALVGTDTPGTPIDIVVAKGGPQVNSKE